MTNNRSMHQRLFLITVSLLLFEFNASAQENWKLVKDESEIKVYTKTESGSRYKAFKAEMQVSCKIENIVGVLKNTDSINNWVVNCKAVKLLKSEDNDQYYYK